MAQKNKSETKGKTCIKGTGLSSFGDNSNMAAVDVKDGKLLRIRPFHYDWKYKPEEWQPWEMEAHGKTFTPPLKSMVPPHGLAYKKRVFSPNRILYPLNEQVRQDIVGRGYRPGSERAKKGN